MCRDCGTVRVLPKARPDVDLLMEIRALLDELAKLGRDERKHKNTEWTPDDERRLGRTVSLLQRSAKWLQS